MTNALIVGMGKTGTTIVATVIRNSIPGARLFLEPANVALVEKLGTMAGSRVVKLLYDHWMTRPYLLTGIVRGEAGFRPDRSLAIVRDPRDGLISVILYSAFVHVAQGATREQAARWIAVLREKEAEPEKYSVLALIEQINRIFATGYTYAWFFDAFRRYMAWVMENSDYLHLLSYEDFVAGKTTDLARYLGVEVSSSREVEPGYERVARGKLSGDWRRMMLPEDVACWRGHYGSELAAYGYDDWELVPGRIDPAVCSDYISRITDEAFQRRLMKDSAAAAQSRNAGRGLSDFAIRGY